MTTTMMESAASLDLETLIVLVTVGFITIEFSDVDEGVLAVAFR